MRGEAIDIGYFMDIGLDFVMYRIFVVWQVGPKRERNCQWLSSHGIWTMGEFWIFVSIHRVLWSVKLIVWSADVMIWTADLFNMSFIILEYILCFTMKLYKCQMIYGQIYLTWVLACDNNSSPMNYSWVFLQKVHNKIDQIMHATTVQIMEKTTVKVHTISRPHITPVGKFAVSSPLDTASSHSTYLPPHRMTASSSRNSLGEIALHLYVCTPSLERSFNLL